MFNQDVPDRRASTLAPLDPAGVAAALRPFGESLMLPAEAYTSDQVFAWEQRNFFSGWMCVGRSADVASRGTSAPNGSRATSVLLVRDEDGALHAFANTCRHRGHELLQCGASTSRPRGRLPVPRLDLRAGRLAAGRARVQGGRDVPPRGARPAPRAGGRVARLRVRRPSGTAPDLATYLGDLEERIAPYRTERLVVKGAHEYVIEANWKVISRTTRSATTAR
jgi:Rieske 2Fe-2S family protein